MPLIGLSRYFWHFGFPSCEDETPIAAIVPRSSRWSQAGGSHLKF
ncbi:MAG: hypothetical protein AB4290_01940 [Spirulina sp.]